MNSSNKKVSRRRFITLTAAAAMLAVAPLNFSFGQAAKKTKTKKPNSKFGGVQIGAITYSWRSMSPTAEDTLKYCLECGISSIELMSNTAELFAGMPQAAIQRPPREATEEQRAAFQKAMQENAAVQRKWRLSAPMNKFEELRKMYSDAGVKIHIAKFSPENWSDEIGRAHV